MIFKDGKLLFNFFNRIFLSSIIIYYIFVLKIFMYTGASTGAGGASPAPSRPHLCGQYKPPNPAPSPFNNPHTHPLPI